MKKSDEDIVKEFGTKVATEFSLKTLKVAVSIYLITDKGKKSRFF
jgi:hypothetical protein